jgi:hypothetical protein
MHDTRQRLVCWPTCRDRTVRDSMLNVMSKTDVPTLDVDEPDDAALCAKAYHEAGHAVLSVELLINDADGYAGFVHSLKEFRGMPDVETTGYMRSEIEKRVMVTLAGVAAQRAYSKHTVRKYHGSSDREEAQKLLELVMVSGRELKPWIEVLEVRTEVMVGMRFIWPKIKAVAEALIERKTLNDTEVKAICDATERLMRERQTQRDPDGE